MSHVKIGITVRNMGPQSDRATIAACARAADEADLESLWVADHIAIPPDQSEGSEGRYLDPLATLAYLAGITSKIRLGTGVLILPYRSSLATAKTVATVQELSGERLELGVGLGWMPEEFRVVGVDRRQRGAVTDATLEFFARCFASDVVEANGQPFLFKPRPSRPPILVGGAPPHALRRAVQYGDGWMPMSGDAATLRAPIAELRDRFAEAGRGIPEVASFTSLPLDDADRARAQVDELGESGVTRVIHGLGRYSDATSYRRAVAALAAIAAR